MAEHPNPDQPDTFDGMGRDSTIPVSWYKDIYKYSYPWWRSIKKKYSIHINQAMRHIFN